MLDAIPHGEVFQPNAPKQTRPNEQMRRLQNARPPLFGVQQHAVSPHARLLGVLTIVAGVAMIKVG